MRKIEIPLSEILSLVNCAEDYGFADDVLFDGFASWAGRQVTDAEIAEYAAGFLTAEMAAQGYSQEDHDGAVERLTTWRDRYCKPAVSSPRVEGRDHG